VEWWDFSLGSSQQRVLLAGLGVLLIFFLLFVLKVLVFHGLVVDQELFERLHGVLQPQVLVVLESVQILNSLLLDVLKVDADHAHHLFDVEVISQLGEEITLLGSVQSLDENRVLEEVVDPSVHGIVHRNLTLASGGLSDRWVETHTGTVQLELNLKNRDDLVFLDEDGVDLLIQMLKGSDDGLGDSFKDDLVHVVDISFPNGALLVDVDLSVHFSDQLVDLVTVLLDVLHLLGEHTLLLGVVVVHSHGSVLAFEDLDVDVFQTEFDSADSFLHDLDHFESEVHMFLGALDEIGDHLAVPLELIQGRGQSGVHLLDSVLDQRFFHGVKTSDDLVVGSGKQVQRDDLGAVELVLGVDLGGGFGHG
jgi:hypothetical protein